MVKAVCIGIYTTSVAEQLLTVKESELVTAGETLISIPNTRIMISASIDGLSL